jgi:hypothetical protein
MVEQAGVVVACPHCGAHLTAEAPPETVDPPQDTSKPDIPQDTPTSPPVEEPAGAPATDASIVSETTDQAGNSETTVDQPADSATHDETAPVEDPPAEVTAITDTPEITADTPVAPEEIPSEPMSDSGDAPVPVATDEPSADATPLETADSATEVTTDTATPEAAPAETTPAVPEPASDTASTASIGSAAVLSIAGTRGVSRHTFTLVRNYAIAMTLAVIFLVYKLLNPNMSALESLPDVKPQKKDDKIVYKLVPEATEMPPGHQLSLGQSQRFGNLKVTPVRVTKEPINFVHHQGNDGIPQDPTSDVVKLWFEFENLSTDQSIAPLNGLVFKRDDNDWENVRSNNFVCRQSEKKKGGKLVFVYDHLITGQWDLRGQHAELEIAPGEKLETYIPTGEDDIAQLLNSDEPLVWRVHFRKGYSPKNYGVTTVIEVAFESSDIGAASPAPPKPAPEAESDSAAQAQNT